MLVRVGRLQVSIRRLPRHLPTHHPTTKTHRHSGPRGWVDANRLVDAKKLDVSFFLPDRKLPPETESSRGED